MEPEYGRVYSVETRWAGANVDGDHPAGSTTLNVLLGWDFDEDGGECEVDEATLSYSSAVFPDPADEDDDEPIVLHLAAPLPDAVDDGAFVKVLPGGADKVATVEVTGQGEPVSAVVDHALFDRLADGIRGDAYEAETVQLVQDDFGSWRVINIVGQEPVVDGGFIDPDTMPPAQPVEPPAVSKPTLEAMGIGALRASWVPVENATPVMYDVDVASSTLFPPGTTDFAFSTAASSVSFSEIWDGPIDPSWTLYVAVRSRSEDQLAEWSPWSDGAQIETVDLSELEDKFPITETDIADDAISTPKLQADSVVAEKLVAGAVTADKIAANSVNARHISAQAIDGEKLSGQLILGSDITTALDGERHGLSVDEGHYSYGPDGERTFQAQGGSVYVDGEINARSLNVEDGATWSGENVGAPAASTMMGDRLSPPGGAPQVENFWETIELDGADVVGDVVSARRGLVWHDNHWWVASAVTGPAGLRLLKFDSDGTFENSFSPSAGGDPLSLTLLGNSFYAHFGSFQVRRFDATTGSQSGFVTLTDATAAMQAGVLGSDGTNLILVWADGNKRFGQAYDTSGDKVGAQFELDNHGIVPIAVTGGSFDFGSNRLLVSGPQNVSSFTPSGSPRVENVDHRFKTPGGALGLAWNGSVFASLTGGGTRVQLYTGSLGPAGGREQELAVAATWYDSDPVGGPHETVKSPSAARLFFQRASYRLKTSAGVPSGGGSDDPNGARFYVGRTGGRAKLERQATVGGVSPGQTVSAEVSSLSLPAGSADASNPPPASGDFPNGTPYRHYSQAVIPGTTDPQTMLEGDGSARLYGLVQPWLHVNRDLIRTLPNGDWTAQQWNQVVDYTPDGGISRTNNDFDITVEQAGVYEVSAQATANGLGSGSTSTRFDCRLIKNSTEVAVGASQSGSTTRVSTSISGFKIRLAAGDTLQYQIRQASGSSQTTTADGSANWLQITRVHN